MRIGLSDLLELFLWPRLPASLRSKVASLKTRGGIQIPKSNFLVLSFSDRISQLFPGASKIDQATLPKTSLALILTMKDELDSLDSWFYSFKAQRVLPNELLISDGGSQDGSAEVLENMIRGWQAEEPERATFDFKLIRADGNSIAEGRNLCIQAAKSEIIAATDMGCKLDPSWFERIVSAFALDSKIDLSMGWYHANPSDCWSQSFLHFLIPPLEGIQPSVFLPSARSIAFRKSLWSDAGQFPEYLSFAGEDSLYAYYAKFFAQRVAFVPEAVVSWDMPEGFQNLSKMVYRYSKGDAEGGKLFWQHYLWTLEVSAKSFIELVLTILFFTLSSFIFPIFFKTLAYLCLFTAIFRIIVAISRFKPLGKEGLSFSQKVRNCLAALAMFFSQTFGFASGLLNRKEIEHKRILAAGKGRVLVKLEDHSTANLSLCQKYIRRKLKQGSFVTVLEPLEFSLELSHPHLESFKLEHFNDSLWREKFLVTELEETKSFGSASL